MDECISNNPCGLGAECVNRGGSFACICPQGFALENIPGSTQTEPPESLTTLGNYYQEENSTALSTMPLTKTGAGLACVDVDECDENNGGLQAKCGTNAKCINFPGSYRCLCPSGFQGQGYLHCES